MTQFGLRDLSLVSRRSLRFAGTAKSPEEFVLSRNLRRRHLSIGQKAAIALEWADQLQLVPRSEKTKTTGRPRVSGTRWCGEVERIKFWLK